MAERYSAGGGGKGSIRRAKRKRPWRAKKMRTHTGPSVSTLPIHSRRIMRPIEVFFKFQKDPPSDRTLLPRIIHTRLTHKVSIRHNCRVKLDPHRLCMVRITRTHQPVTWVLCVGVTTSVPDRRFQYTLVLCGGVVLQKDVLDTPEAACGECGNFGGSGRHCEQCASDFVVSCLA